MFNEWLTGEFTGKNSIMKAVVGEDIRLATKINTALETSKVERVLSRVDANENVKTYRLDKKGNKVGEWP